MLNIQKRDNTIASFDLDKVKKAIKKAFDATKMVYTEDILNLLVLRVTSNFQTKVNNYSFSSLL